MPRVSIVIPTYNRHAQLGRCLDALRTQSWRDFEVVVVDDGSDPPVSPSPSLALTGSPPIRVVRTPGNGGPARARNLGVAAAVGEFVAFIDDDVAADRELLQRHVERASRSPQGLVQFGPLAAPPDWRPTAWNLWEAHTLEIEYDRMRRGIYAPTWRQFFTGNAFLRRSDFLAAGGFDEHFTRAEDVELGYRLAKAGCRFEFVAEAVGWHYSERSVHSWLATPRDYARFDVSIDRLHPELGWLDLVRWQQERRNVCTRAVSRLLRAFSSERVGVWAAVRLARISHAFKAKRLTVPLLSVAYAVEYSRSLRAASGSLGTGGRGASLHETPETVPLP